MSASVIAALWLVLASRVLPAGAASAACACLLLWIAPGWGLVRRSSDGSWLESAAVAFTVSLGITTVLGLLALLLHLPLVAVMATIAVLTIGSLLGAPPTTAAAADRRRRERPGPSVETTASVAAAAVLAIGCAWLAAGGDNIARDRMWYLGYVTHLATAAGPIDWREPMLGSGHVVARFACNAWLLAVAMATRLSGSAAPWLFERVAPVLVAALVPAAAFKLSRRLFAGFMAPVATAITTWIVLTTRYPFFSPERYVGFGRFSEDKTVALLILAPVLLALCLELLSARTHAAGGRWTLLALAAAAVGLTHPLVYLFCLITVFSVIALARVWRVGQTGAPHDQVQALLRDSEPAGDPPGLPDSPAIEKATVVRRIGLELGAVLIVVAAIAGAIGWQARSQNAGSGSDVARLSAGETDPVVRAHLRMKRHVELPVGGPITNPRLLAEPILAISLLGLWAAWRRRSTWTGVFLLGSTLPMLALAFVPLIAPLFGRLVLPWMVYRTLWAVPFGFLLTALAQRLAGFSETTRPAVAVPGTGGDADACGVENPRSATPPPQPPDNEEAGRSSHSAPPHATGIVPSRPAASRLRVVAVWTALGVVLLSSAQHFPWSRLTAGAPARPALAPDHATVELLGEIARLPEGARVAAARGLAELVPAYTGHPVLAFSDRGTTVFSRSRRAARRRLLANALLIGMAGVERRLRDRIVGYYDVSATVFEGHHCDRDAARIFHNQRYSLCLERKHPALPFHLPVFRAVAGPATTDAVVARLGAGIRCTPPPEPGRRDGIARWRRVSRFSGRPVAVDCRVTIEPPTESLRLRIGLHLPRAEEVLVYRIAAHMRAGGRVKRRGGLEFKGNPYAELRVPGAGVDRVRLRLVPATLPYLNLVHLELTAPATVRVPLGGFR